MPYIVQERRDNIDWRIREIREYIRTEAKAGDLTYIIYRLVLEWTHNSATSGYEKLGLITGLLEATKLEFVRKILYPYEASKQLQNGDIE